MAIAKSKKSHLKKKEWSQCRRQQKYNRNRQIVSDKKGALNFCDTKGFKPNSIEFQNIDTEKYEVFDVINGSFSEKQSIPNNNIHSVLYVKDKFSTSDQAYHELSMVVHGLPKSSKVKKPG